jgi:predicted nucleic acid-binding protein
MEKVLIDSCIVIDYINGDEEIERKIKKVSKPCINFIIEMELMQGARNKRELQIIKKKLEIFWLLPMQDEIAKLSSLLIDTYSLSHNLEIPDGIIASTALIYNLPLFTHNIKDFRFIPNIEIYSIGKQV